MTDPCIVAVDPGREKCGVAVVGRERGVLWRQVVEKTALLTTVTDLLERFGSRRVILGDQTASANVHRLLQPLLDQAMVDEIAQDKPLRVVSAERAIQLDHDKTNIKERFKQLSPETEVKFI